MATSEKGATAYGKQDAAKSEAKTSKYADKVGGYVAKPAVKEIYAAMKVSAKAIDGVNSTARFLAKPGVKNALTVNMGPAIAAKLGKVAWLSKALGPAGVALGVGFDLLVAFGFLEDATMKKLDEISHQIEELRDDVRKGFEALHVKLDTNLALQRFLPIYDQMLAKVQLFERIVVRADGKVNADILYERLGDTVADYPPDRIITDLLIMHNLITGKGGFGKPLFEQLAEGVNTLEGEKVNHFLATNLLQFQNVVALQMRAVRMLRSYIAYKEEDVKYSCDVEDIFKDLADQWSKHDPFPNYEWYFNFRAVGGTFTMTTEKWPDHYMHMPSSTVFTAGVCHSKGDPKDDQNMFIITPCSDSTYLISSKKWPHWYVSIPVKSGAHLRMENPVGLNLTTPTTTAVQRFLLGLPQDGVQAWCDRVRRDRWFFTIKHIRERKFVVTDAQIPNYHMCMASRFNSIDSKKGDPGLEGTFILTPQPDLDTEWYLNFRAFGGTYTMATTARPGWNVCTDRDDDKVRGFNFGCGHRFIITPRDGGTFLIQTEITPTLYLYMKDNFTGDVKACTGDPGPQGYWCIECTDTRTRTLIMSTAKWPNWYMYMKTNDTAKVRGERGDPGPKGHFILH